LFERVRERIDDKPHHAKALHLNFLSVLLGDGGHSNGRRNNALLQASHSGCPLVNGDGSRLLLGQDRWVQAMFGQYDFPRSGQFARIKTLEIRQTISSARKSWPYDEVVHNKHAVEGLKAKGGGCDRLMHPN
jgi:hypothetical protein